MKNSFEYDKYKVQMIGGKNIPDKFLELRNQVDFLGYREGIVDLINKSDLIIGAGRVAIEALLMGKNVIAIGEGEGIGLVSEDNIHRAIESNFGDISYENKYDWEYMKGEILKGLDNKNINLREILKKYYDLNFIVLEIEKEYNRVIKLRKGR